MTEPNQDDYPKTALGRFKLTLEMYIEMETKKRDEALKTLGETTYLPWDYMTQLAGALSQLEILLKIKRCVEAIEDSEIDFTLEKALEQMDNDSERAMDALLSTSTSPMSNAVTHYIAQGWRQLWSRTRFGGSWRKSMEDAFAPEADA